MKVSTMVHEVPGGVAKLLFASELTERERNRCAALLEAAADEEGVHLAFDEIGEIAPLHSCGIACCVAHAVQSLRAYATMSTFQPQGECGDSVEAMFAAYESELADGPPKNRKLRVERR